MNESNDICPLGSLVQNKNIQKGNDYVNKYNKVISDTCSSKICTEATIKFFEVSYEKIYKRDNFNESFDIRNSKGKAENEYVLKYLKSDECISQQSNGSNLNGLINNYLSFAKIFIVSMLILIFIN